MDRHGIEWIGMAAATETKDPIQPSSMTMSDNQQDEREKEVLGERV